VGQVFKFVRRLCWKINVVCMSLSPFDSFQSLFVIYLLNCPRKLTSCYFLQGFVLSTGPEGEAEFPVNKMSWFLLCLLQSGDNIMMVMMLLSCCRGYVQFQEIGTFPGSAL
jgi:hypothetical protein